MEKEPFGPADNRSSGLMSNAMNKPPTRTVIFRYLTPAQQAWMKQNIEYECIGPPRPEVKFTRCGTQPAPCMSTGAGIPTHIAIVSR